MFFSLIIFVCITGFALTKAYTAFANKEFKLFHYMLLWFAFIYNIVPLFYLYDRNTYYQKVYSRILTYDSNFFFESLIVLIAFVGFIFGYRSLLRTKYRIQVKIIGHKKIFKFALILSVISILSYLFFLEQYGGIDYVLSNISSVRSGTDDNKNYLGAFAAIFSQLIIISFLLLLYLKVRGYFRKRSILHQLVFWLVSAFLFLKMSIGGGRAALISIFVFVVLELYYLDKKIKKLYLIGVIAIALFTVFFGKVYLFTLFGDYDVSFSEISNRQGKEGYMKLFIYEFNHQFLSISNYVENDIDWRYLKDYFIWLFKPMRFFTSDTYYDSISYYNTYHINGDWESNIPPGSLAMGYINGGIFGVLLQSVIVGRAIKWLDLVFRESDFKHNGVLLAIYLILFNSLWYALQNGDIALIIQGNVAYLIVLIFLFVNGAIQLKKYK